MTEVDNVKQRKFSETISFWFLVWFIFFDILPLKFYSHLPTLATMGSEKYCLKWNDFQTNVSKSFGLFRNESYLHDVTLVSDDYKHIPAHKLVLSACSEYFKNILQQTKQSQPLLCLDGVSSTDLQNVLDYVYEGEVRIYQEDLDRFLNVAQKLKLEGLMGDDKTETVETRP